MAQQTATYSGTPIPGHSTIGPRCKQLARIMESINLADSSEESAYYRSQAADLGLWLKGGFYIQRRSISPRDIYLVRNAASDDELTEILKDLNYDEAVR